MENESDGEIYSDLSESCSETTPGAKDSRFAVTTELDLLDTPVLPREATPVNKDLQPQVVSKTQNLSAVNVVDDDGAADIYSDLGESCSQSKRSIEEAHSAASAELDLLDTSVLPRQPTPLKKDGPPKLKTSCTPGRLTVGGNATSSPALSSTARAAIVALKKENGMLRHNISVLYKTAKQLLDSRDREIVSLQRRLDNLVFKRNLGSQNSPHAAATATSARDLQQRSQRQSHSPWNSSGTSSVRSPHGPSAEKRNDCPDPTAPAMPKVDMSGDLQRLYEYNNVRPKHRTEYSHVPKLAVASRKKKDAAKVPVTPTKSAAQRNAKRLLKNSLKKISGSPTKLPRRMEANRKLGLSPLKKRRASDRAPLAARFSDISHQERRGATSRASPKDWPMEQRSMQSRTPPFRHKSVAERPCTPRDGWSPEPHLDRYTTPPRDIRIAKGPHTPPENQPVEPSAKHFSTPPLGRRAAKGPQTPPDNPPELATKGHGTPPLEGRRTAKGPHTPPEPPTKFFGTSPLEKRIGKEPSEDHSAEVSALQYKQEAGPSKQALKNLAKGVEDATNGSPRHQDVLAKSSRPSGKSRPRERLGIKRRRSPTGYARSTRLPLNSLPEEVEARRVRSPRESEDFYNIPAKRRRSRSRSFSRSPSPRPYSPRQHLQPQRVSVHDRLDFHHTRRRVPRHHRHSLESRSMHRRSREHFSPPPRRHHRTERPAYSPSPPRLAKSSQRQPSPGRPESPISQDKCVRMSPLSKQPAMESAKRTSSFAVNISVTSEQAKEKTSAVAVHQIQETPCQSSKAVDACALETETLPTSSAGDIEKTKESSEKTNISGPGDG
ncbi:uncharacterized protein LOC144098658 [Amblyomma americanum]